MRRMSFRDNLEKRTNKRGKKEIDHVGVGSDHHSPLCRNEDFHRASHVCKENIAALSSSLCFSPAKMLFSDK